MAQITETQMDERFAVLVEQNHAGTFNGCLETIGKSLEQFVTGVLVEHYPTVVLDHRTMLGKRFGVLRGNTEKLIFFEHGKESPRFVTIPSVFTEKAERLLYELIEARNFHVHTESLYPLVAEFTKIVIPVGQEYELIFNPTCERRELCFDDDHTRDIGSFMALFRPRSTLELDVDVCEHGILDLTLECLTRKQFTAEFPDHVWQSEKASHALVIYYGRELCIVEHDRRTYTRMKKMFDYDLAGAQWKTHYFRFLTPRLTRRLLV